MEIIQERLDREFNMDVITTVPNVSYMVYDPKPKAWELSGWKVSEASFNCSFSNEERNPS